MSDELTTKQLIEDTESAIADWEEGEATAANTTSTQNAPWSTTCAPSSKSPRQPWRTSPSTSPAPAGSSSGTRSRALPPSSQRTQSGSSPSHHARMGAA